MDSSVINVIVAALAFAIAFAGVRGFIHLKNRRKARLARVAEQARVASAAAAPAPMNKGKRRRLEQMAAKRTKTGPGGEV